MLSPLSQVTPIDSRKQANATPDHAAELGKLREQLDHMKQAFAKASRRVVANAVTTIDGGAQSVRHEIRGAPLLSIGIAATAGVLVAVAITMPRPRRSEWQRTADRAYAALPDIDTAALRRRLQYGAGQVRDRALGVLPSVEQLAEAVSRMEASSVTPMLEKGATWARGLWDLATSQRPKP